MIDKAPAAISIKVTNPPVTIGAGDTQIASKNGARANQAMGAWYRVSKPATIPVIETIFGSSVLDPRKAEGRLDELNNVLCPRGSTLLRQVNPL